MPAISSGIWSGVHVDIWCLGLELFSVLNWFKTGIALMCVLKCKTTLGVFGIADPHFISILRDASRS